MKNKRSTVRAKITSKIGLARDRFYFWLSARLPRKLVLFCLYRVIDHVLELYPKLTRSEVTAMSMSMEWRDVVAGRVEERR